MDSEFPHLKKTIQQILKDSVADGKPLEIDNLEFKSFWEVDDYGELNSGIRTKNMKVVCGMLNQEGGVVLIGINKHGKLVDLEKIEDKKKKGYKNTEDLLKSITSRLSSKFGRGIFAANIKVNFEHVTQGDKTQRVVRIDIKPAEDLVYFEDADDKGRRYVLPVRINDETQELDARGAVNFERNRRQKNVLLKKTINKEVPKWANEEFVAINDLFGEKKYDDTLRRSYTLMKKVMQERYTRYSLGQILAKTRFVLILDFLKFVLLFISLMVYGFWLGSRVSGAYVLDLEMVRLIYLYVIGLGLFSAVISMIFFSKDVLTNTKRGHWIPAGVTLPPIGRPPPGSFAKSLLYKIIRGKDKQMDIEHLFWSLVILEVFTGGNKAKGKMYFGIGYGEVIYELAESEEAIREGGETPNEYTIQYILQNMRLMLNSLYSSDSEYPAEEVK